MFLDRPVREPGYSLAGLPGAGRCYGFTNSVLLRVLPVSA